MSTKMAKTLPYNEFVKRSNKIHNNKYDYSESVYIDTQHKINIICPIHGKFNQLVSSHLSGKEGCVMCYKEKHSKPRIMPDKIIKKINLILPNIKIIKYINTHTRVLVEDKLNIQYMCSVYNLLDGDIPSIQSAIDKNRAFEIKARQIHGNKFTYSKVDYKNAKTKVKIKCPIHGYFMQIPDSHLSRKGCRKCADKLMNIGRTLCVWKKSDWIKFHDNNPDSEPKLYFIHCFDSKEQFIKIGITLQKMSRRFHGNGMPYNYKIIRIIEGDPESIYDLETRLKKEYNDFRYTPKQKFGGQTECFSELIKEPILKLTA